MRFIEYNPTWNLKKTETYTLFEKEHSEKHDGFFDADLFKNTMFNVYLTPDDVLKQFPPTKILVILDKLFKIVFIFYIL